MKKPTPAARRWVARWHDLYRETCQHVAKLPFARGAAMVDTAALVQLIGAAAAAHPAVVAERMAKKRKRYRQSKPEHVRAVRCHTD